MLCQVRISLKQGLEERLGERREGECDEERRRGELEKAWEGWDDLLATILAGFKLPTVSINYYV